MCGYMHAMSGVGLVDMGAKVERPTQQNEHVQQLWLSIRQSEVYHLTRETSIRIEPKIN